MDIIHHFALKFEDTCSYAEAYIARMVTATTDTAIGKLFTSFTKAMAIGCTATVIWRTLSTVMVEGTVVMSWLIVSICLMSSLGVGTSLGVMSFLRIVTPLRVVTSLEVVSCLIMMRSGRRMRSTRSLERPGLCTSTGLFTFLQNIHAISISGWIFLLLLSLSSFPIVLLPYLKCIKVVGVPITTIEHKAETSLWLRVIVIAVSRVSIGTVGVTRCRWQSTDIWRRPNRILLQLVIFIGY